MAVNVLAGPDSGILKTVVFVVPYRRPSVAWIRPFGLLTTTGGHNEGSYASWSALLSHRSRRPSPIPGPPRLPPLVVP